MQPVVRKLLSECVAADVVGQINEKDKVFGDTYVVLCDKGKCVWLNTSSTSTKTQLRSNLLNRNSNELTYLGPNHLVEVVGKMTYQPFWNHKNPCFNGLTKEQFDLLCEKFDLGDNLPIDDHDCECMAYFIGDQRCSCGNRRCRVYWEQYKDAEWELPSGEKGFFDVEVY